MILQFFSHLFEDDIVLNTIQVYIPSKTLYTLVRSRSYQWSIRMVFTTNVVLETSQWLTIPSSKDIRLCQICLENTIENEALCVAMPPLQPYNIFEKSINFNTIQVLYTIQKSIHLGNITLVSIEY